MLGTIDVADIRACNVCAVEALRVVDDDGLVVYLEPMAVRGLDVVDPTGRRHTWGWRLQGRHWRVHHFDATPHLYAFRDHYCVAGTVQRKGTRMTADPFGTAAPPGATGPGCDELEGKLILLTVHAIERGVATKFGPADAARVDIVDLTSGEQHTDTLLFGKVLTNQLTAGVKYVGFIGKGEASGTNSPPWVWVDGSADDKDVAVKYLTYAASQSVATAAPAATAPTPTPAATASTAPPWAQ